MPDDPLTKKSLGQHWLHDAETLAAMCDAAAVKHGMTVLEVGPGTGTLTAELLARGATVVAVELDESLAAGLIQRFGGANFTLHRQSITTFDLTALPSGYAMVANIPYYLTSNLIRAISESSNPPSCAVLLVQKEVAQRVAAAPGDMSVLSVTAQYYWQVSLGQLVPAKLFTPPPKVDSQILILQRRADPLFTGVPVADYFRLVKAGFHNRRKTLLNSLSGGLHLTRPETVQLLSAANIATNRRPQELSLEEWYRLYQSSNH